ncbi:MAG TPA: helix-turn-helix domain-containing protein [Segetibacter sp.]|jgi:hypothetical protein
MSVEVITKEDLQAFRQQLISDIKELFLPKHTTTKDWLRSSEVRKLLNISPGTLQSFRVNGKLKPSKIGGIHFYRYSDIEKLLNENTEVLSCK